MIEDGQALGPGDIAQAVVRTDEVIERDFLVQAEGYGQLEGVEGANLECPTPETARRPPGPSSSGFVCGGMHQTR